MRALQQPVARPAGARQATAQHARRSSTRLAPVRAAAAPPSAASAAPSAAEVLQRAAAASLAAAALTLHTALPGWAALAPALQPAQASAVELAEDDAAWRQQMAEDITEDVAVPPELVRFMDLVQKGERSGAKLQDARRSVGFERSPDGRVLLLTEDGEPFQVKLDMGTAGTLLLRDAGGYLYYLPAADNDSLAQIDLSDDAVVAQLFANHAWEELLEPLEVLADSSSSSPQQQQQPAARKQGEAELGSFEQLRMSERQFRSIVSLMQGAEELPEEVLADP